MSNGQTRSSARIWLLAAACVAGLALTGFAAAAVTPLVQVQSDLNGNTALVYAQGPTDDGAATIQFAVPDSYLATFSHPEGAPVGTVSGKAVLADAGSSSIAFTGQITAAVATTAMANGTAVSAAASGCDPRFAAHTAYWLLNLTGPSGFTLQSLVVVDNTLQDPLYQNFSAYALTICLPPDSVPAGTAGRSPSGARVVELDLALPEVFTVLNGGYTWHALITPYTAGSATPNTAGAVEVDAVDLVPPGLTLVATKSTSTPGKVVVSGRLTDAARGIGGQTVQILAGTKVIGTAKTNGTGRYSSTVTSGSARKLTATASVPVRKLPCGRPVFKPTPCSGSSYSAFTVTSDPAAIG